jgi:hypothetical protein
MTTINSNNGDGQTSPFHDTNGQKPEDDRKLFVGKIGLIRKIEELEKFFRWFNMGYNIGRFT